MKSALKAIIIFISLIVSHHSFSQTKEEVFSNIQKLLSKATGEKIKSFSGEEKITKQLFTEMTVASYKKGLGKYGSEWVTRHTNIPWNDFFEHYIFTESGNEKLQMVKLKFKKNFSYEFFTSDKTGAEEIRQYNNIELHVMYKDKEELDKYLNLLYKFKEKKAESRLNEEIRKFSKAQTISWLTEKFNKHLRGGQYDRDIKIVSLNECKIVVTYSGLVRKYEEEIPTAIASVGKYGYFQYDKNVSSIRTLTPDAFDKGEKTYRAFSSMGVGYNDEELMENVECALKHLAGFCGKTTSSSGATSSISSGATSSQPVNTSGPQWYISFEKGIPVEEQSWLTKIDFPEKDIEDKWKNKYFITDICKASGEAKWFFTFAKTGYTNQTWQKRNTRTEIRKTIKDMWKENPKYSVTHVAYINDIWVMVGSEGSPLSAQKAFYTDDFPEDSIKASWKQGFDVTSMAYGEGGWLVLVSKGFNYKNQGFKKYEKWEQEKILTELKQWSAMTNVTKANGNWYVIFSKDEKISQSDFRQMQSIQAPVIKSFWDNGYSIYRTLFIPGTNQ